MVRILGVRGILEARVIHADLSTPAVPVILEVSLTRVGVSTLVVQVILGVSVIRAGDVAESLLSVANLEDVDLIVMSAHGYGAMKRMLLGSIASKVIRETPVPVLVARRQAAERIVG